MSGRICPICASKKKIRIEHIKLLIPQEYHLPSEYWIVECEQCGFCYADTNASVDDYNVYYSECNTYSGTPVDMQEWDYLHTTAGELLKNRVQKDELVIDMGFGQGNFLKWLRNNGYTDVMGIDPSQTSVDKIREVGIRAEVGSVFHTPDIRFQKQVKCVFLFDVLEHLLFPREAIINIKEYLKEEGYLVISVPNYAYLKNNNNPITNMFNQEHINYFSVVSLDNLMSSFGFKKITSNNVYEEEIIALYQLKKDEQKAFVRDTQCGCEIRAYVSRFEERKNRIQSQLSRLKQKGIENIYVWGTGAFTMWLLANTTLTEFNIIFIDNNKTKIGNMFWESVICGPDSITDNNQPIVICSMLYAREIEKQIVDMDLSNELVVL